MNATESAILIRRPFELRAAAQRRLEKLKLLALIVMLAAMALGVFGK